MIAEPVAPVTYKRILAVKLADLGDLLTTTPALQALRAAHPSAQIDLLVPPSSAHLLRGVPYLDNILSFDKFAFDSLRGMLDIAKLAHTLRFLIRLRLARYDAIALFHHFTTPWGMLKFDLLLLASGARTRAGLDNGRGHALTLRIEDRGFGAMHEADYWLRVASLLGANRKAGWRPHVPISQADRQVAARLLGENIRQPVVAMHAGAGAYSRARIWPVERFAEVARGLVASHDARIVIVGGPGEEEGAGVLEGLIGRTHTLSLAGHTSIHETAAVLERCDLFVGNDSGPMHLAAAVGTPVVAIFGPSNSHAWGPYTPPGQESPHTVVARDLPCMPCFYRGHSLGLKDGCGTRPCLIGLLAGPVLSSCRQTLDAK
ncbi:MAG: glycosyltransferase family 9 protein [Chloroflexota bacterium]|nr:glycosyltransferase family 9 protein [Chloroflexota bacterium]